MEQKSPHVLLLPYPSQGHINPMLQFGKRLAFHNIHHTIAITRFISNTTQPEPGPVSVESISDGFDEFGVSAASSVNHYLTQLESVGSESLSDLLESLKSRGEAVQVLVYDAFLPWAYDVATKFGLRSASFFTQACVVDAIYWQVWKGLIKYPVTEPVELAPGLPVFEPRDLPSFLSDPEPGPYPAYWELVLNQYKNLEKADVVLINSFYELEPEEFKWMKSWWKVKSIGPTLPSSYIDNRIPSDSNYGFNLHSLDTQPYLQWLDSKPPASVLYISFGSMAQLNQEQTKVLACALSTLTSNISFLWVVRSSEVANLPANFVQETLDRGLVVTWCNQIDVLAHESVGCFLTHCGWNSTMEGISLGVPMIGMPQWTDQTTNAKYVEGVWRMGVRVRVDEGSGLVTKEEIQRCVKEVMGEGERSEEFRTNAAKWKELANGAISEGGSSDSNIIDFISELWGTGARGEHEDE